MASLHNLFVLLLLGLFVVSLPTGTSFSTSRSIGQKTRLDATKSNKDGVYVRPSGAIERGSGFFVPGLEGSRVRFVVGGVLLTLTAVNHRWEYSATLEELLAVGYGSLVLLQAGIESVRRPSSSNATQKRVDISARPTSLASSWKGTFSENTRDRLEWAISSYLSLTPPAQTVLVLEKGTPGIAYRRGSLALIGDIEDDVSNAACELLSSSTSGRLSLPATHPIVTSVAADESKIRSAILQRVKEDTCILVLSDQLLVSYTPQDLAWLGQLAAYCGKEG